MSDRIPPFFIVSSGRSGTTLLSTILNASGQVFVPPESDFIARAYPFYGGRAIGEDDYPVLARLFRKTSQKDGWGMTGESIVARFSDERPKSFRRVNETLYRAYLDDRGLDGISWGIKRPVLIANMDRILDVFPEARIIHLCRDGRDVYLSYGSVHERGFRWGPRGVVRSALYWTDGLRRVERGRAPMLELRYEDLVEKPETEVARVCGFLGIRYERQMIERSGLPSMKTTDIVQAEHRDFVHRKVYGPIDRSNLAKYETRMGRGAIFRFELFAAPYLRAYRYPLVFPRLGSPAFGPVRQLAYFLARAFNDARYRRRDRRILQSASRPS